MPVSIFSDSFKNYEISTKSDTKMLPNWTGRLFKPVYAIKINKIVLKDVQGSVQCWVAVIELQVIKLRNWITFDVICNLQLNVFKK